MHLANQAQLITCIWLLLALKQQHSRGQNGNAEASEPMGDVTVATIYD